MAHTAELHEVLGRCWRELSFERLSIAGLSTPVRLELKMCARQSIIWARFLLRFRESARGGEQDDYVR